MSNRHKSYKGNNDMMDNRTLSDHLTGKALEPAQIPLLKARILRAPIYHGTLTGMDIPAPPPDVEYILAKDIPGLPYIRLGDMDMPILASDTIQWAGQPILAAVGKDVQAIEEWFDSINLHIEPITSTHIGSKPFERSNGDISGAFQDPSKIVEQYIAIPSGEDRFTPTDLICSYRNGTYKIYTQSFWPQLIESSIALSLDISKDKVEVVTDPMIGHGYNVYSRIWHSAFNAIITALLSHRTKQPVRLKLTPENRPHLPSSAGYKINIRASLNDDKSIDAIEAIIELKVGASFPFESEMLDRLILGLFSHYPCNSYSIKGNIYYNAFWPSTFGPACGFELGFLAGELLAAKIAASNEISPYEWRQHNIPSSQTTMGSGIRVPKEYPVKNILDNVVHRSDYERKAASCEQNQLSRGYLKNEPEYFQGIGLSCSYFGNGFTSTSQQMIPSGLCMTLNQDQSITVNIPNMPSLQMKKIWATIIADRLKIEPNNIQFIYNTKGGHALAADEGPCILGRHITVYTDHIIEACSSIAKKRVDSSLPISTAVCYSPPKKKQGFERYSWGTGVIEVTLNTQKFSLETIKIWLSLDCGKIWCPKMAESVVESEAEEAVQWCLGYPKIRFIPAISIDIHTSTNKKSSQISCLPWLIIPAALLQAVGQASGRPIDSLPITSEKIGMNTRLGL